MNFDWSYEIYKQFQTWLETQIKSLIITFFCPLLNYYLNFKYTHGTVPGVMVLKIDA